MNPVSRDDLQCPRLAFNPEPVGDGCGHCVARVESRRLPARG